MIVTVKEHGSCKCSPQFGCKLCWLLKKNRPLIRCVAIALGRPDQLHQKNHVKRRGTTAEHEGNLTHEVSGHESQR